jgi:hypothetical protein
LEAASRYSTGRPGHCAYDAPMAGEVGFGVHDERGSEVLDELERKTGVRPYLASPTERHYNLTDGQVDASGIDAMLDTIAEDWHEHLSTR